MGYYVTCVSSKFEFKPGTNLDEVRDHLKATMFSDETLIARASGGASGRAGKIADCYWYSWTNTNACLQAKTVWDIIDQFFEDYSIKGDGMSFEVHVDTKIGDEDVLLDYLTPYLQDGSHLYYRGSDDCLFGWEVRNSTLVSVKGSITWS